MLVLGVGMGAMAAVHDPRLVMIRRRRADAGDADVVWRLEDGRCGAARRPRRHFSGAGAGGHCGRFAVWRQRLAPRRLGSPRLGAQQRTVGHLEVTQLDRTGPLDRALVRELAPSRWHL